MHLATNVVLSSSSEESCKSIGFLIVDSGIGHLLEIDLLDAGKVH
jgi:hypothetical protein